MSTDYEKYRGKCLQYCKEAMENEPETSILTRGYYICPIWGEQEHWWIERANGEIFDPTKKQFPSKGLGEYVKYDGTVSCEYCRKSLPENDAYFDEHHVYCSSTCYGRDVGF